jgi:hypothetical protein
MLLEGMQGAVGWGLHLWLHGLQVEVEVQVVLLHLLPRMERMGYPSASQGQQCHMQQEGVVGPLENHLLDWEVVLAQGGMDTTLFLPLPLYLPPSTLGQMALGLGVEEEATYTPQAVMVEVLVVQAL